MPKKSEITPDEVSAAEAEMLKAKKGKNPLARQQTQQKFAELRSAWRQQEIDAGRRGTALVKTEEG